MSILDARSMEPAFTGVFVQTNEEGTNRVRAFRRDADGWFGVYVQQELGHYVAEAVLDALAGLEGTEWA